MSNAAPADFPARHIGSNPDEQLAMLSLLGFPDRASLIDAVLPPAIRLDAPLDLPPPASEADTLLELQAVAARNRIARSFLGAGYHGTHTPGVIRRNILENPGWYTAYTPYQAEIAQGRLEALLNFQTMVCDLTGLDVANASLLDEGTAAAEAVTMAFAARKRRDAHRLIVSPGCHPQTLAVLRTRMEPLGIEIDLADPSTASEQGAPAFAGLIQYPATDGALVDPTPAIDALHAAGALAIVAADPLALAIVKTPGECGADIAVGSTQRFGIPIGFGGPHAAYLAARDALKRQLPGRLVGVSKDARGRLAYRLALQTREQHIRREKATSNICTAQVLLAVMASMYAVYHGPDGLRAIAHRIRRSAASLAASLRAAGHDVLHASRFDTVAVQPKNGNADALAAEAAARGMNLRLLDPQTLGITLDETSSDLTPLLDLFGATPAEAPDDLPASLARKAPLLAHPIFNQHDTETEMLRYLRRLESKDLSLTTSMIPLGSCTMKLNATSQMLPVTWEAFGAIHPFAPTDQTRGYAELIANLERWLGEITGLPAVSLQPNAGSQGEYAGLLAIRAFHRSRGDDARTICLIPTSAHGTNPASAVMAGFRVVPVACTASGDIDLDDLRARLDAHAGQIGALMVTYPSTHGVFEEGIRAICDLVHTAGGQVYMDGANMNAQVGLTNPARIGADVCHLNLHKTFCIPHGGGGPGVGPVCAAPHLAPFLPQPSGDHSVASAPAGSASILVIPWMYIRTMGADGLRDATEVAILNANYIARRLENHYPVLFKGRNGLVAHECILDLRAFKIVTAEDVAKRLMDFGFHAPTLSWPVAGTLMVEPTESEPKAELDRFCEALIAIRAEIAAVESGAVDPADNPLKNAPHPAESVCADSWPHAYPREQAAYPAPWLRDHKFWPAVARIDNVWGDRNLFCACPSPDPSDI